ncbi:MAG: hypothetical protein AB4058_01540 [Microcystaceae cyanobacterium]
MLTLDSRGKAMHTIETQVNISRDHVLNIELPDNIAEGTYQVVIVMNPQTDNELDDYETPDEEAIEGIREGLKQAFSNQTIPLSQMWEGIDVE